MHWDHHFAIGCAGTFVLYLLDPTQGERVYLVMSVETNEPVKWICSRAAARAWLQREALMSTEEIDHAMWGADEWFETKLRQACGSHPPARKVLGVDPVAGPLQRG